MSKANATTICLAAAAAMGMAGSASAFVAPSSFSGMSLAKAAKSSSQMQMSFENELGVQTPTGFFDPLNLLKDADQKKFDKYRYCEIKHGRIAMLAVTGYLAQATHRLPGLISASANLKFSDIPNGVGAIAAVPTAGLIQILAFIAFMEVFVVKQVEGSFPGDTNRGFEDYWNGWDAEEQMRKRQVELNNGRAAMMGFLGIVVHEQINGRPFVVNDIFGIDYQFP